MALAPSRPLSSVPSSVRAARRRRARWSRRLEPEDARRGSRRSTLSTASSTPLPAKRVVAVAQLDRLELPGRRARRHHRPSRAHRWRGTPRPRPSGSPASRGPRGPRCARSSSQRGGRPGGRRSDAVAGVVDVTEVTTVRRCVAEPTDRSVGWAPMAPTSVLDRPARQKAPTPPDERINRTTSIPFLALHLVPLLADLHGRHPHRPWCVCAALYLGRMFFITAGYHRYFSHRRYRMARVPQFLMAFGGTDRRAEGAAVVGGPPPRPPPLRRHRPRPPLAVARASGGATSAGSSPTATRRPTRTASATSPRIPSCAGSTATTGSAPWALGDH